MADRRVSVPGIKGRPVTIIIRSENVQISRSAKFGSGVVLDEGAKIGAKCEIGANSVIKLSSIGARTVIGERSRLGRMVIGERVRIGSHAYCWGGVIGDRAVFGDRLWLNRVSVAKIVAGNNVKLEGRGSSRSTIGSETQIGNDTEISSWESNPIGNRVIIGARCHLLGVTIENAVVVGDDVALQFCQFQDSVRIESGAKVGCANIGSSAVVGRGTVIGAEFVRQLEIGHNVRIGEGVIVRPGVNIPSNWEIPPNVIVNPHQNGPVTIPRTP